MSEHELPLILEPERLESFLGAPGLLVVDLSKSSTYLQYHIPGAVHLEYGDMVASRPPVAGLLPEPALLQRLFSRLGIGSETHVVAYDDEGGGRAARLLWTLELLGHRRFSLLNGGLIAWANENHPLVSGQVRPEPAELRVEFDPTPIAEANYILEHLNQSGFALVDARGQDEYTGRTRFSARGGHIPGAVHWDWVRAMDQRGNLRLRPAEELRQELSDLGMRPEQTIVAYCQTHHRSSLVYLVLKSLGYAGAKGYPGSWSDWGNRSDTPVAEGPDPSPRPA
jgi:thiosulfate/3-mercaptopyruvate sulfurtransferase